MCKQYIGMELCLCLPGTPSAQSCQSGVQETNVLEPLACMNYQQEIAGSFPIGTETNEACIRKIAQKTSQLLLIYPKRLYKLKSLILAATISLKHKSDREKKTKTIVWRIHMVGTINNLSRSATAFYMIIDLLP